MTARALLLAARSPWPARRGDQLRASDFIRALRELGYEVEVLVAAPPSASPDRVTLGQQGTEPLPTPLHLPPTMGDRIDGVRSWLSGAPLQVVPFRSKALENEMLERVASFGRDDLIIVQLARQLPLIERLAGTLKQRDLSGEGERAGEREAHRDEGHRDEGYRDQGRPRLLVDLIDTLSLNAGLRARGGMSWQRPFWAAEARRLGRAEKRIVELADSVALVCERDRLELLSTLEQDELASGTDRVHVVPLPVPPRTRPRSEESKTSREPAPEESSRRSGPFPVRVPGQTLILSGNLGYFVNERAARWFATQVWPLLRTRAGLRMKVAGARPTGSLRRVLAKEGVELIADPVDLREVLSTATLALVPLRGGAGVPVKILEAWAESVPVVASAWAALGVRQRGEETDNVARALAVVADGSSPGDWAAAVIAILDDPERRATYVAQGRTRVEQNHSWQAFLRAFERWTSSA